MMNWFSTHPAVVDAIIACLKALVLLFGSVIVAAMLIWVERRLLGVWQDRYGRDPAILGKTVRINDVPTVVIGVMPPGRRFPEETDLWMPLIADRDRKSVV